MGIGRIPCSPKDVRDQARVLGATEVEIHNEQGHADVHVAGLGAEERQMLKQYVEQNRPAGVSVDIIPMEDKPVLTQKELLRVVQAMPDDWHPSDTVAVGEIDWDSIDDLVEKYGGRGELFTAASNSAETDIEDAKNLQHVADGPEMHAVGENKYDVADICTSAASEQRATQKRTEQSAAEAWMNDEIGLLEFERRLEDEIDPDWPPKAEDLLSPDDIA